MELESPASSAVSEDAVKSPPIAANTTDATDTANTAESTTEPTTVTPEAKPTTPTKPQSDAQSAAKMRANILRIKAKMIDINAVVDIYESTNAQLRSLQTEAAAIKKANATLRSELQSATNQLNDTKTRLAAVESQLSTDRTELNTVRSQLQSATNQLNAEKAINAQLRSELEAAKRESADALNKQLAAKTREITSVKLELRNAKAEVRSAKQKLLDAESERAADAAKIEELQSELKKLRDEQQQQQQQLEPMTLEPGTVAIDESELYRLQNAFEDEQKLRLEAEERYAQMCAKLSDFSSFMFSFLPQPMGTVTTDFTAATTTTAAAATGKQRTVSTTALTAKAKKAVQSATITSNQSMLPPSQPLTATLTTRKKASTAAAAATTAAAATATSSTIELQQQQQQQKQKKTPTAAAAKRTTATTTKAQRTTESSVTVTAPTPAPIALENKKKRRVAEIPDPISALSEETAAVAEKASKKRKTSTTTTATTATATATAAAAVKAAATTTTAAAAVKTIVKKTVDVKPILQTLGLSDAKQTLSSSDTIGITVADTLALRIESAIFGVTSLAETDLSRDAAAAIAIRLWEISTNHTSQFESSTHLFAAVTNGISRAISNTMIRCSNLSVIRSVLQLVTQLALQMPSPLYTISTNQLLSHYSTPVNYGSEYNGSNSDFLIRCCTQTINNRSNVLFLSLFLHLRRFILRELQQQQQQQQENSAPSNELLALCGGIGLLARLLSTATNRKAASVPHLLTQLLRMLCYDIIGYFPLTSTHAQSVIFQPAAAAASTAATNQIPRSGVLSLFEYTLLHAFIVSNPFLFPYENDNVLVLTIKTLLLEFATPNETQQSANDQQQKYIRSLFDDMSASAGWSQYADLSRQELIEHIVSFIQQQQQQPIEGASALALTVRDFEVTKAMELIGGSQPWTITYNRVIVRRLWTLLRLPTSQKEHNFLAMLLAAIASLSTATTAVTAMAAETEAKASAPLEAEMETAEVRKRLLEKRKNMKFEEIRSRFAKLLTEQGQKNFNLRCQIVAANMIAELSDGSNDSLSQLWEWFVSIRPIANATTLAQFPRSLLTAHRHFCNNSHNTSA